MSSQNGAYDQNLLDEAPAATRAQRQEGYKVDLLDDRPTRPTSTQPLRPPHTIPSDTDVESSSLTREKIVPGAVTYTSHPTQSFWRTRNGKITIFVIAIVVIGAVVGGAVGGTVGKIGSNNNAPPRNVTSGNSTSPSDVPGTGQTNVTTTPSPSSSTSSTFSILLPSSTTSTTSATSSGVSRREGVSQREGNWAEDAGSDDGTMAFYRL
ncbi:uncharacterized protein BJ212DRAFT_1587519 [Suillus subaureus]|uniref:Uncharacterized protein n=1 Tax=Suillus subaureus TaxID=48587 RepID=A0A9P7EBY4_9AGAM|nr:uncharacterized protein BJ212DRAFT_1587519 [Suillus subaureus]KAG1816818.1 hypothetical protein BJ212DRAFT_1587519 [Suillus subaureus]